MEQEENWSTWANTHNSLPPGYCVPFTPQLKVCACVSVHVCVVHLLHLYEFCVWVGRWGTITGSLEMQTALEYLKVWRVRVKWNTHILAIRISQTIFTQTESIFYLYSISIFYSFTYSTFSTTAEFTLSQRTDNSLPPNQVRTNELTKLTLGCWRCNWPSTLLHHRVTLELHAPTVHISVIHTNAH